MTAPHFSNTDDCLFTALALKHYGGGFASAIGEAFLRADLGNRRHLIEALPHLFDDFGPGSVFFADARRNYYGERVSD